MTARYRYYVANFEDDAKATLVWGNLTPAYTAYNTLGHWEGTREPSLTIEVIGDEQPTSFGWYANQLALWAREVNDEECILVSKETNELGLHAWTVTPSRTEDGFVRWERVA